MKSNYFIDTSLLKSLSIGIKEAIVLDFFTTTIIVIVKVIV